MPSTKIEKAYQELDLRRATWKGEEEVRVAWIKAIENGLGIILNAERIKVDSSYNNVYIEFKDAGLFKGSEKSPKFKEAIYDRLLKYICKAAVREGLQEEDYIGGYSGEADCCSVMMATAVPA